VLYNEFMSKIDEFLIVRDATETDIAALTSIKGAGTEAVHFRRLSDARAGMIRYLVILLGEEPIGFGILELCRPDDASYKTPSISDLEIKETLRGRGYGTALLSAIEQIARASGFGKIYLQVEPVNNRRAYTLYQRLGYHAEQTQPYYSTWEFVDSTGKTQRGEEWVIDMVKQLS
jgi:ribosomal protein S18 acetylase RimI-like enzyme